MLTLKTGQYLGLEAKGLKNVLTEQWFINTFQNTLSSLKYIEHLYGVIEYLPPL